MTTATTSLLRVGILSFAMLVPSATLALTITSESNGGLLAETLFLNLPGVSVTSAELFGFAGQAGLYRNVIGTYGLPQDGIVFSSGNVRDYQTGPNRFEDTTTSYEVGGGLWDDVDIGGDGAPPLVDSGDIVPERENWATASQEALLQPITGMDRHFDVVQLNIDFETAADVNKVTFFGAFGSEEYPEYVGGSVTDGFGLFVNGANQAGVAAEGGGAHLPVNIDHPNMAAISGTELDGILAPGGNPVLRFDVDVLPGQVNNFTIILADAGDAIVDTTVYLSSFLASTSGGDTGAPVPATGSTEFDPLLPIMTADGTPVFDEAGGFTIDIAAEIAEGGDMIWVDPPVSVGFTYDVTGGSLITSITAPSLATVADIDGYTINFGLGDIVLAAGATYTFGGGGVDFLTLSGIDTSLSLDPTNPLAFPVGMTFDKVMGDFSVVITPITEDVGGVSPVPLPASGLLYIGAMLLGGGALRRRQKAA
ncbi:hypothetical protein EOK75_10220 [Pseudorhodobacter turbinis]|uniref:VPLPA-CTERM sorting domain-containing protein n=1 Tax=Pseudorhodobacter turbinis TaxID=2500533 RepID=A0A4P8EHM7_9RHOB|nr:choice-of-anchor L domain-containing protein [Pseudorhodobacter turbinis]QCO56075.1 hypothetical protein EOK75_10220 [Pseudorhodobacter turbinis]